MKHTPRPWPIKQPNGPGCGWKVGPAWLGENPHSEESAANARLISEAPEMLAMLEELEWCEVNIFFGEKFCSCCEELKSDGHSATCELGNLLAKVRGG